MTETEVLIKMKDILERMFLDEDVKNHQRIQVAYEFVISELSKDEPNIFNTNFPMIIAGILQPIFDEHELPIFEF